MDETCKEVASSVCDEAVLEPCQDFVSAAGTDMTPEEEFLSSILSGQDLSDLSILKRSAASTRSILNR